MTVPHATLHYFKGISLGSLNGILTAGSAGNACSWLWNNLSEQPNL